MKFNLANLLSIGGKLIINIGKRKLMLLMLKVLAIVGPWLLLIGAGVILILLWVAPIIDAISKIDALKSDVSGFMDEVGNFFVFRSEDRRDIDVIKRTEDEFYKALNKEVNVYNNYVIIDVPLVLATLFYPYDWTNNEYMLDYMCATGDDGNEVCEGPVSIDSENEEYTIYYKAYETKKGELNKLIRNMVTILRKESACMMIGIDENGEPIFGPVGEPIITEYTGNFPAPKSQSCESELSTQIIYEYQVDYDKYENYLRTEYLVSDENLDLYKISKDDMTRLDTIIEEIKNSASLYNEVVKSKTRYGANAYVIDVVFTDGAIEVIYYNQKDSRYANYPYEYPNGVATIGTHGCGPTSMAMVVSSLTNQMVDPIAMTNFACPKYCTANGTYHSFMIDGAIHYGLKSERVTRNQEDLQKIVDALASGSLVIAVMGPGTFTRSGHFILLRGVTASGDVLVADPNSIARSKAWPFSLIVEQSSRNTHAPFWIISK